MNLVIVESPAKARTIEKYLGSEYKVIASVGHIIDLPGSELGVDIDNNFEPKYTVIDGKEKIIKLLKSEAKKADKIFLAPDPDREGEAIAWHIASQVAGKGKFITRVLFNEITKKGVLEGINNPIDININRVNAQQSRRILDRLVGYLVSPLLWKPLKPGLSAGRVQSVALKMICEREDEIEKFTTTESWSIEGEFTVSENGTKAGVLKAKLDKIKGAKAVISNEDGALAIISDMPKDFKIANVEKKEVKVSPSPAFITSRMQQEAIRKLNFTAKKTMMIAQSLYEGIELGDDGPTGLITYMRTDSTRLSPDAIEEGRKYIVDSYGDDFYGGYKVKSKKSNANVQDAHEAIRPTSVYFTPDKVKKHLTDDQYKLYKLIWERFVSSLMSNAIYDQTSVTISGGVYDFKVGGRVLKFAGFTTLYSESVEEDTQDTNSANGDDEGSDKGTISFDVKQGSDAIVNKFDKHQHFTQPPKRYTESSIVRVLENDGIGRPSTYASIISTIIDRNYVELKQKKFFPSELGRLVNRLLVSNFSKVFDQKFTAYMESELDKVEEGVEDWKDVLKNFYTDFNKELSIVSNDKFYADLQTSLKCPKCNEHDLMIKYGKNGVFLACTDYPTCKFTSNYEREESGEIVIKEDSNAASVGIDCELCGKELVMKSTRFGDIVACSGYPECKNIKNFIKKDDGTLRIISQGEKVGDPCPLCGSDIIVKGGKNGIFAACSAYPKCKHTANIVLEGDELKAVEAKGNGVIETDEVCDKCGKPMVVKKSRRGPFIACSGYPECKNTKSMKK